MATAGFTLTNFPRRHMLQALSLPPGSRQGKGVFVGQAGTQAKTAQVCGNLCRFALNPFALLFKQRLGNAEIAHLTAATRNHGGPKAQTVKIDLFFCGIYVGWALYFFPPSYFGFFPAKKKKFFRILAFWSYQFYWLVEYPLEMVAKNEDKSHFCDGIDNLWDFSGETIFESFLF